MRKRAHAAHRHQYGGTEILKERYYNELFPNLPDRLLTRAAPFGATT